MKKFRVSRLLFLVVFVVLSFSTCLFFLSRNPALEQPIISPIRSFVARVDSIISVPFRFFNSATQDIRDLLNTYSENKLLKEKIATLEDQSELVSSLKKENKKLSSEIEGASSISSKFSITGKVIVRNPSAWYEFLSVKLSDTSSIKKGMLVTSNGALIGLISDVDSKTASVKLLSNGGNFDIPVKISTSSGDVYGLLKSYDSEKKAYLISDLNASTEVKIGDSAVTSGLDGDTIADVNVGNVSNVIEAADSLKREIYITPKADFSDISYVTIVGD